jgi:hypothetical protein
MWVLGCIIVAVIIWLIGQAGTGNGDSGGETVYQKSPAHNGTFREGDYPSGAMLPDRSYSFKQTNKTVDDLVEEYRAMRFAEYEERMAAKVEATLRDEENEYHWVQGLKIDRDHDPNVIDADFR